MLIAYILWYFDKPGSYKNVENIETFIWNKITSDPRNKTCNITIDTDILFTK